MAADRAHRGYLAGLSRGRCERHRKSRSSTRPSTSGSPSRTTASASSPRSWPRWCRTAGSTTRRTPVPTSAAIASTATRSAGSLPEFQPVWDAEKGAEQLYEAYQGQRPHARGVRGPALPADRPHPQADRRRRDRRRSCGMIGACRADVPQAANADEGPIRHRSSVACRDAPRATPAGTSGLLPVLDLGTMPKSDGLCRREQSRQANRATRCSSPSARTAPWCRFSRRRRRRSCSAPTTSISPRSRRPCSSTRGRNAEELIERLELGPDSLVVEPASNDGYLLKNFARARHPGARHRAGTEAGRGGARAGESIP